MIVPEKPILAVVQLNNQPKGVIHQVVLRPDKVKNGIIRLGETYGDEILGWQHLGNVEVVEILGEAVPPEGASSMAGPAWTCVPIVEPLKAAA